jgi:hypothetical protein
MVYRSLRMDKNLRLYNPPHQYLFRYQPIPVLDSTRPGRTIAGNIKIPIAVEEGQFVFCLNSTTLPIIQQAQQAGVSLRPTANLLADLRRYSFFDASGLPQSGMTFCTYYRDRPETIPLQTLPAGGQFVTRSVISLDGDVIHQVREQSLAHPDCFAIVSAHHWLINQLLSRLRTSVTYYVDVVIWSLPKVVLAATVAISITTATVSWSGIGLSCLSFFLPRFKQQLKQYVLRIVLSPSTLSWASKLARRRFAR